MKRRGLACWSVGRRLQYAAVNVHRRAPTDFFQSASSAESSSGVEAAVWVAIVFRERGGVAGEVHVECGVPRDLALHDLARAETGFVGVGLRAAAVAARPAAIGAAREIDDAEVWVMMPRDLEHRGHVGPERAGVRGGYQ